ncbi:antirestriction protein ArdA [Arsenicicoccus dermatophilus]|uniref:antirestriction protein ArdA n=1 Tax=Arsenicicoccus dermatophilus TaxID=1076331 RepID=UPI001F4C651F|nr:antirestriction protein ArdA [Arsenicicoccus dermatophilus]MCH8613424.1 antirestriction protein ArdA [Arsenicicoccus dermatophilus]
MSGTPLSDRDRRRSTSHPEHLAEIGWMREHHRPAAWIDAALDEDLARHGEVGAALCHVIGAHLEPEPESPLGEFVVYDILRPAAVLAQLDEIERQLSVRVRGGDLPEPPTRRSAWLEALRGFCEQADALGSAGRERDAEPRPMLYVARATCRVGAWIDMTRPERTVEEALAALPGDPTDTDWTVQGRLGFYGVYPLAQPELWTMHALGQGIDRHGEAYAAYAEYTFQQGMSEHDFEARYRGHVRLLEEFVHAQAAERGWLAAIARLNAVEGLAGAVQLDLDLLTRHVFSTGYSYEPGRAGFHIFGPPTL